MDGNNTYSYTYDENGIRTSKTVNGVTTYYNTKDGVILSQSDGTNTMYFQYDMNGIPLGFIYDGAQYFYDTNQMGDVIGIIDSTGEEIVQYEYDEWGTLGSLYTPHDSEEEIALANINPIRYRGYYFDNETGYYYLQSRYYDSSICRFINADEIKYVDIDTKLCTNIFTYCTNDPINKFDPDGHFIILLTTIIKAICLTNLLRNYNTSAYIKVDGKTRGEGIISINIEKDRFYEDIYKACKIDANATYEILTSYAEDLFYKKNKRNIYFSEKCMKNEIKLHIDAFFWYKGFIDYMNKNRLMKCPTVIYSGALLTKGNKTVKQKIYSSTRIVDISEKDIFTNQAIAFDYYYGIRSDYKGKKTDPYYQISYKTFLKKCK